MRHIKWFSLAMGVLMIAVLACGGGRATPTTAPSQPTAVPQPTEAHPTATPEAEETGSLEIINNSSIDVWYVYISPSDSDEWGEDWLGSDTILAGESYTITGIEPGTYDLKAEDSEHNTLVTEMGVEIEGEMTWTLTDVGGGGEEIAQWATGAAASSEWGSESWTAQQATGAPNTEECGDYGSAWASSGADTEEWIELTYDTPVYVTEINIYQTYNPDQVVKVELIGSTAGYHEVYRGVPEAVDECPYVLSIPVDGADYLAAGLRITIDQSVLGLGWNEIDAVELIGLAEE